MESPLISICLPSAQKYKLYITDYTNCGETEYCTSIYLLGINAYCSKEPFCRSASDRPDAIDLNSPDATFELSEECGCPVINVIKKG